MYAKLLLLVNCLLFALLASAQIDQTLQKLDTYHERHIKEKIYLHLDKNDYSAGETMWFKLYCTTAPFNYLSNISKIANVELISPTNKIIKSIKIPITLGLSIGDFNLPDTLEEGSYRVRSFTRWMQNDSVANFYERVVPITNGRSDHIITKSELVKNGTENMFQINLKTIQGAPLINNNISYTLQPNNNKEKSGRLKSNDNGTIALELKDDFKGGTLSLQFLSLDKRRILKSFVIPDPNNQNSIQIFPESGELVNNILSKTGFKILSPNGLGKKAKIKVVEENQTTVADFETNSLGMGSIPLVLQTEKKYVATALFEDGSSTSASLPPVQNSGYVLTVNSVLKDKIAAQLSATADLVNGKDIYLIAQYNGLVLHAAKQKLNGAEILFNIPKKNLPSGVLQLSILTDQMIPIVERLVFNYNTTSTLLPVSVELNKLSFTTRDKVIADLSVKYEDSDTTRFAALSASVVNLSKVDSTTDRYYSSIVSELLLKSDLRGFIERPNYYFADLTNIKLTELDNLMLIQGWRKLDWKNYTSTATAAFLPEKGLTIAGTIKKTARKAVVPNAKVTIIPTSNMLLSIDTLTDNNGRFSFDELLFADSVKFIVTGDGPKEKKRVDIVIDNPLTPPPNASKDQPLLLNDINSTLLTQLKNSQQFLGELEAAGIIQKSIRLEEVQVNRVRTNKADKNSRNLNGPGNADQVISADELSGCATFAQCLNGRLNGVIFRNGIPYSTRSMNSPMQVVLDGMYIEPEQIDMINTADIASVEVLRSIGNTAIYGMYGGSGVIVITSKSGDAIASSYTPTGIVTITPKGLYVPRTFFKPQYDATIQNKLTRDLRTTIAWEPNLITPKDGKTHFEFFTSDEPGTYKLTVEGISMDGKIAHLEYLIAVKPQ
ncbi:TonB-dependent receptor plug domain-containing protein [Sphingobacterium multivorum]|uniref:carboxypeptidase-like regulatory domain-containing protein n=1 Tax=Sphingobacterium multivorum TaxID=28454 RepID=UPI0019195511|nr:carboxypeptidase-like regulatory domain-containing protein [Sphingobacterium multivorum]QQT63683.1 TonB-dependent receptor plug domain-containing protein [Sphingobacterium multivorum]